MIIYLDQKTYNFLSSYTLKPGNIELELRFGHYDINKNFKPDIGYDKFKELESFLSQNSSISRIEKQDTIVEIYEDNTRKIVDRKNPKNIIYEKKTKLYNSNIWITNRTQGTTQYNRLPCSTTFCYKRPRLGDSGFKTLPEGLSRGKVVYRLN
jgi:hypothetical protein